jgi:hypothetical protein
VCNFFFFFDLARPFSQLLDLTLAGVHAWRQEVECVFTLVQLIHFYRAS